MIHGTADRLVRPSGGRATARAIAGSKLVKVDGMGHDLPRAAWDQIVAAIVENAQRAGFSRTASGSVSRKAVPPSGRGSAQMRPPWASTTRRQIASPMPLPS